MLVDCHCHLEDKRFDPDREAVIARCRKELAFVVDCGTDLDTNIAVLGIHERHPEFVYASLGLFPSYAAAMDDAQVKFVMDSIRAEAGKIVALGEVGLDYYWTKEPAAQARQREVLRQFIELARELDKPMVVHSRNSMDDLLGMLARDPPRAVVFHHFSGNATQLESCIDQGFYASLCTGFSDKRLIKAVPVENLLVETDSPYNCPVRGERNEPIFVRQILNLVNEVKEMDVTDAVYKNALRVFSVNR